MRLFTKLIGLCLILAGIYFLGQNIIFTTRFSAYYWWRSIPATGSVLSTLSGVVILVCARRSVKDLGWVLVGLGILMAFLSGGLVLQPTSLWTFFVAAIAMVSGYQLLTFGRVRF
ncbi:hypothetical protein ACQ4M4_13350 [Leptolyngbya sp. AN02str]|uniref:hypothetical protein n=1 Tax=Leptolyngbya sp. AN02str TaxID=3423363 RepID=UPI003D3104B0